MRKHTLWRNKCQISVLVQRKMALNLKNIVFCLSASLHLVVRVHHAIAGIVSFLAFNFWVKLYICVPRSDCWCAVRAITEPCKNRCLISFWCARPPHRTRLVAVSIAALTSGVRGATASSRYLSCLLAVSAGHVRYNLLHSSSIGKLSQFTV